MDKKKLKVLVLSDHALSTSGVGTQTRHLINGLLEKDTWTFRQFGAALKHTDYETIIVNEDFIIKPIDGFGDPSMLRLALATEKPDILFLFTDPRFFIWLFEMEDEIHQMCPIVWWHVWDNYPYPSFNSVLYESTDLINCHSHLTYEMIKEHFPNKTNFVPHALPENLFFPLSSHDIELNKQSLLGPEKKDWFVGIWVNRNAKRKRPNDVLWAWHKFLKQLEEKEGHKNAVLLIHADPMDHEGPNLYKTSELLKLEDNIVFSPDRLEFEKMNVLYNISDFCINVSYAEGFGLPTLEAMMTGTPIIAVKTGGLTRQVVDHRDESENGIALEVDLQTMVGSQQVPFIYEDYAKVENISNGIFNLYTKTKDPVQKKLLSDKVLNYAKSEFGYQKTIDKWHDTMLEVHSSWKEKYKKWEMKTL